MWDKIVESWQKRMENVTGRNIGQYGLKAYYELVKVCGKAIQRKYTQYVISSKFSLESGVYQLHRVTRLVFLKVSF
jgi:hypothetical protein